MALSYELISQFAKLTKSDNKTNTESTVYGTIKVDENGNKYVKLDGSDQLTPLDDENRPVADTTVNTAANANDGERVSVLIKNHTATVTGNISSPAARTGDVEKLEGDVTKIQEFDILIGKQVRANEAYIKKLQTDKAEVGDLTAATAKITELEAKKASVEDLNAATAEITNLKTTKLDAEIANTKFATIENLTVTNQKVNNIEGEHASFRDLTTEKLSAVDAEIEGLTAKDAEIEKLVAIKASIEDLEAANAEIESLKAKDAEIENVVAEKASIEDLDATNAEIKNLDSKFANIDFANITELAVENLNAKWGLIKDLTSEDGVFTGELVGVTIKGDLIEGGTIKADKLIIKDSKDGLYYKLNFESGNFTADEEVPEDGIHGKAIIAKSLTADQINVSDLVAFGAKIGGFNIADGAIYSGVKASVDNPTRGTYLDDDGQISLGDSTYFLRYFKETTYVRSDEESDLVDGILLDDVLTTSDDPVYVHTDDEGVKSYFTIIGETSYKVEIDEKYKLAISAESIWFGDDGKTSADDIRKLTEHVKIGNITETSVHKVVYDDTTGMYATEEVLVKNLVAQYITATKVDGAYTVEGHEVYLGGDFGTEYICFVKDTNPSVELAEGDSDFKQVITNKKTMFMDGGMVKTTIDTDGVHANNLTADGEIRHGRYRWSVRPNGNYRLSWMEEVE